MIPPYLGTILGTLLLFLGASQLLPGMVAVIYDETHLFPSFLFSALLTAFVGGALFTSIRDVPRRIRKQEVILLVIGVWLVLPIFASVPFMTTGVLPRFTDAYFESMSALTTTGSSVVRSADLLPHTILFWRALLQWMGGIMVFIMTVSIMPLIALGGMDLFYSMLPHREGEGLTGRLKSAFFPLVSIYIVLTLACAGLLWASGLPLFEALCDAMSTLSTGGFSTQDGSIASLHNKWAEMILIPFMIIASTNMTFHWGLWSQGRIKIYKRDPEWRYFMILTLLASLLVFAAFVADKAGGHGGGSVIDNLRNAVFVVVSAISTTGFVPNETGQLPLVVIFVLLGLIVIGGASGSTAGGLKIMRLKLLLRHSNREVLRLSYPNAVVPIHYAQHVVPNDTLASIWGLFYIFLSAVAIVTVLLGVMGFDFQVALTLAITNICNAGPLIQILAPDFTGYASLSLPVKWLISASMVVGRLEIVMVLLLFTPAFWKN